jgi:putative transposase
MLRGQGWVVNVQRVERIWRREGLKVPHKQPKRGRLWLNDGSCVRLRPECPNHVPQRPAGRCSSGERIIRLLADDGPMTLSKIVPTTDAGSACSTSSTSSRASAWRSGSAGSSTRPTSSTSCPTCSSCAGCPAMSDPTMARSSSPRRCGAGSQRSEPRRPTSSPAAPFRAAVAVLIPAGPDRQLCCRWENGYCESFNAKLRDELLNGEIFTTLKEARIVIEGWRRHYNTLRPHSSLDYQPPAPEVVLWPAKPALAPKPIMH